MDEERFAQDREGVTAVARLITHNGMLVNGEFLDFLMEQGLDSPDRIMRYQGGTRIKEKAGRTVLKISGGSRTVYLKRHVLTLAQRLKSLIPGMQEEDGQNEWQNMLLLEDSGFNTMTPVAFGMLRGCSFTLTEEIRDAEKLETYLPRRFAQPLDPGLIREKRTLITHIGKILKDFHARGFTHQDFYLGHLFFREADEKIFIADLQRMHQRSAVRGHDRIKDAAQLLYSCLMTRVLTRTDLMRLAHAYLGRGAFSSEDKGLMRKIIAKTGKIARHDAKLMMKKGLRQ